MDSIDLESINKKLQILLKYEKELARELKATQEEDSLIKQELTDIKNRIEDIERKYNLLDKKYDPSKTYKDFTPLEVLEMNKTLSLNKLSKRLNCSLSTVQRMINKAREEQRDGRQN